MREGRMLILLALCTAAAAAALPGTFFYLSTPTHANETLLLLGGPAPAMLSAAFIQLCAYRSAANCTLLRNVQPTPAAAKALLPAGLPLDVFSVAPCAAAQAASCAPPSALLVNAPRVAWQQGDASEAVATPGGYIRLFGSALAFSAPPLARCVPTLQQQPGGGGSAARLALLPAGGGPPLPLPLAYASCYALTAPIPAGTPPGDYLLQLDNGLPSCGWVGASAAGAPLRLTVAPPAPWPAQVFNVATLGSVWAALQAAAANGGGTVFFPRGRYAFNENQTLNAIPPRTTLQGEGTDLVELYWRDMAQSPRQGGSPTSMVQGLAGHFALRNLTLYVQGNFTEPVVSDAGFDGLIVSGVIIRANPYYMMLEPVNQSFHGRSMGVGSGFNSGAAVHVSGCSWAITDSDLLGGSHAIDIFVGGQPSWYQRPCNGLLARSTLVGGWGMYRLEGARGVIIEDNVMRGGGMNAFGSWISTYYARATEFVYFARNRVESVMGGDRELLSFDGGGGAYLGGVARTSADGATLTLASDPVFNGYIPPGPRLLNYTEAAVCVLDGAGAGQVSRVLSNDWAPGGTNRSWVLRAPFAVPLDNTSVVSIVPFRGDIIVAGNTFTDGGAIQLYAMAISVVVAENVATRTSGFLSWGLNPHNWGVQPNFYTSFLGNTVAVGNAWGGQSGGFATVSASDQGSLTLNRGVVLRGNVCASNAGIAIGGSTADVVVEGCAVRLNEVGIAVDNATTSGVWLRGNTFEGVAEEVRGMVSYAPGLSCCCNATDAATGVATVTKPFASYFQCVAGSCEAPGEPDPW